MILNLAVVVNRLNIRKLSASAVQWRAPRWFALVIAGLSATLSGLPYCAAAVSGSGGGTYCDGVRLQDEIVVVDTRMLCGSCDQESLRSGILIEHFAVCDEAGHRRWQRSSLEYFLAFDSTAPTIFYIHGNQLTAGEAKAQGLALYRRLTHCGCDVGPIRFVIFSWPSAQVGGLLRDVQVKAMRTGPAGCQLAWLLDQMRPETPISLIGFSFGARIITGSLHILAGGSLGHGMQLVERNHTERPPMNVVLIAAALHSHWLGAGQYHGLAMTQVDRMFLLNNCSDLAMRYYHLSSTGGGRPQALGLCGPTYIGPEYTSQIRMRDVSRYAGAKHDLFLYLSAPGACAQVWSYTGGSAVTLEALPADAQ